MLVLVMSGEALLLREANLTGLAPVLLVVSIRQETTWWWDTSSCGNELMVQSKVRWCFLVMGGVGVEETKISRLFFFYRIDMGQYGSTQPCATKFRRSV